MVRYVQKDGRIVNLVEDVTAAKACEEAKAEGDRGGARQSRRCITLGSGSENHREWLHAWSSFG